MRLHDGNLARNPHEAAKRRPIYYIFHLFEKIESDPTFYHREYSTSVLARILLDQITVKLVKNVIFILRFKKSTEKNKSG